MKKGFTLIELLIVVAIIAILAAIAVPNFLEAQLRSKVSRTKADLRTISIALESYAVDTNGKYPILNGYIGTSYEMTNIDRGGIFLAWGLSTPIAYTTTCAFPDPFNKWKVVNAWGETTSAATPGTNAAESYSYHYVNTPVTRKRNAGLRPDERSPYFLISFGPDYVKGPLSDAVVLASPTHGGSGGAMDAFLADYANASPTPDNPNLTFDAFQYDPSNGTVSGGDIIRHR